MGPAFDLVTELAEVVRDGAGASRFIQRFAAAWAKPVAAGDGYGDELLAAEARLGFALPAALRRVYETIGRRDDLTRVQDHLLMPAQLGVDETGEVLVFRAENQSVAEWGVPLAAIGQPDPAVVFRRLDGYGSSGESWRPFMDRMSLACVEMVLSERVLGGGSGDNRELDEAAVDALESSFSRLPLPDYPLWAEPDSAPIRWFGDSGVILRQDAGSWLWVQAVSAERLAEVRRTLPGEWLLAG